VVLTCIRRLGTCKRERPIPGRFRIMRTHVRSAVTAVGRIRQVHCVPVTEAVIRRAGEAELSAIARLRREWTLEQDGEHGDPGFEERFAAWFERESPHRVTWLAEVDGHLVGMMNLAIFERMPRPGRLAGRWGYLGNAFVLAAYRNQGIGGQLLDAVLRYADENGFARVVLSPTERSVTFYQRAGFGSADALMLWTPPKTTA
jgi:GNAT superfamily N-acetyltransferase